MSKRTEHGEQEALFEWAANSVGRLPELALMFAIPNAGGYTGGFKQNVRRVQAMKNEGLKKGVPDIFLPVARNGYRGLFLELKTETGKLSKDQRWWIDRLREQGYYAVWCRGYELAKERLEIYLAYEQKTELDI
jgi:hypothetical protein